MRDSKTICPACSIEYDTRKHEECPMCKVIQRNATKRYVLKFNESKEIIQGRIRGGLLR